MNAEKYLKRIGIDKKEIAPNVENLKLLQRQHLLYVPFENLDIHWQRPITLNTGNFYRKIIEENRGGFCYELNGLFNELLKANGFQTKLISARVAQGDGEFGREKDHLAITVEIGGKMFITDVGFGSFFTEPLELIPNVEQQDSAGTYLIRKRDADYSQIVRKNGEKWTDEIIFTLIDYDLQDFAEMCDFHQTSPQSHFTRQKICSLLTADGRKTLTDNKFIETVNGVKNEIPVNSEEEFNEILEREFKIEPISQSSD